MITPVVRLVVVVLLTTAVVAVPLSFILDTDVGDDFDDSWALTEALTNGQTWDMRMVLTAAHNTVKRAQIVAKYLTLYNRTDIPIGIGIQTDDYCGSLYPWAEDVDLKAYVAAGGTVYTDGVQAAAQMLMDAKPGEELSVIAIAPMTNLATIVLQYPEAAARVPTVYSMYAGVDYCYGHKRVGPGGCREYNIFENTSAAQTFMHGPWKLVITPLDTCDDRMDSTNWNQMLAANDSAHPFNNVLMSSFTVWAKGEHWNPQKGSDILHDPVAVWLAASRSPFKMETIRMSVLANGTIVRDPNGVPLDCAMEWVDDQQRVFFDVLSTRIVNMTV